MNIHHLELFYYVARHGGISSAVRHIPYGIQQPAVSSQVLNLEADLGKRLFERSPFRLTAEGAALYEFARPFFDNLDATAARLRKEAPPQLRIGAAELVLSDHLPAVLPRLRAIHPQLRMTFRSGYQAEMERALAGREIDLAIMALERRPPPRTQCLRLVKLPLVLLVPRHLKIKSVEALWAEQPVAHPLICLPPTETISRRFREGLQRRKIEWPVTLEASSLELIVRYVGNGYGIGVGVQAGQVARHPTVRALELPGVEPIEVVALWNGKPTPPMHTLLTEIQRYAREVWPTSCSDDVLPPLAAGKS
jgi:DNA-binding transcriptional LysR family regulator